MSTDAGSDPDEPPEIQSKITLTYDGELWTARDEATGVASCGETRTEALRMLDEAVALHEDGGEPIDDEAAFLREIGIDPTEIDADETPPPWLREE